MRSLVYLFVVYLITPLYAVKFSVGRRMTVRGRIMSFDDYTRAVSTATKQFNVNANATLWYEPESVSDPTSQINGDSIVYGIRVHMRPTDCPKMRTGIESQKWDETDCRFIQNLPLVNCSVLIYYRPYWPSGTRIELSGCSPDGNQVTEYNASKSIFASRWVGESIRMDLTEHELNESWFNDTAEAAMDMLLSRRESSNLFWPDHIYAPTKFEIPNGYYVMYTLRLTETVCIEKRDEMLLKTKQLLGCPEKRDSARTLCHVGFSNDNKYRKFLLLDCLENGKRVRMSR
ncbi:unnamed protein product [Calicophoron daubneyi]|uniref:Uncharacterized protein n=1 Tax=Calicophoron daubneyi TaxID=300641 RepID=A0AAV2TTD5_CALDB